MSGRPSWKSAKIGLFRPFSAFSPFSGGCEEHLENPVPPFLLPSSPLLHPLLFPFFSFLFCLLLFPLNFPPPFFPLYPTSCSPSPPLLHPFLFLPSFPPSLPFKTSTFTQIGGPSGALQFCRSNPPRIQSPIESPLNKTPLLDKLFRKVRAGFCLLHCAMSRQRKLFRETCSHERFLFWVDLFRWIFLCVRNPEKGVFVRGALRKFVANCAPN